MPQRLGMKNKDCAGKFYEVVRSESRYDGRKIRYDQGLQSGV